VIDDAPPPRPGRGILQRGLLAAVLIVLSSAGAVSAAGLLQVADVRDQFLGDGRQQIEIPEITRADAGGPRTILLLGSDQRYGDSRAESRSDTMILARVDPDADAISLLSIPRDLRIPDLRTRKHGVVTDKINRAYAEYGPRGTVRELRRLFARAGRRLEINNVVNIGFGAFRRAINYVGGVYVDVDRDYFNDSTVGAGANYATIDIDPGYQRLKGQDALDYVRFRLNDNDFVRASRQQDFLRHARQTPGIRRLLANPLDSELAKIFRRYVQVDSSLRSTRQIIAALRLALFVADKPIREVRFGISSDDLSYIEASDAKLRQTFDAFMATDRQPSGSGRRRSSSSGRSRRRRASASRIPRSLTLERAQGETAAAAAQRLSFPFYFPTRIHRASRYDSERPRIYTLRDENGRRRRAYRIVLRKSDGYGQYYGVQGMTWKDPPILDNPTRKIRRGGRRLSLYYDGRDIRLVAWRTPRAVYWVSNTLTRALSPSEMIAIAASLRRLGQAP
jgi:polyisoprenyl-teichoic acid--peptidoglycan teichoic acid transferase